MKKRTVIILVVLVALAALLGYFALKYRGTSDIKISDSIERIEVTSAAFEDLGVMPEAYTGNGEDNSPPFQLQGVSADAASIAIIMDDLDIPLMGNYTHWTIWNLPVSDTIPEAIPHGETVEGLGGAIQGMGYGQHQYRGPKPPFGTHRYQFHIFVLDATLPLEPSAGKKELLAAMEGHILQYGSITGWYPEAK